MALLYTINACGYINFCFFFIVCEIWTDLFHVVFMKFGVVDEMMKWVLMLRIDLCQSVSLINRCKSVKWVLCFSDMVYCHGVCSKSFQIFFGGAVK